MKRLCLLLLIIALSACNSAPPAAMTPASNLPPPKITPTLPSLRLEQPAPAADQQGAANRASEDGRSLAARVNNQPIFLDVYENQVAQFEQTLKAQGLDLSSQKGQEKLAQVRQQVLNSLIDQVILEQEAARLGLTVTDAALAAKVQENIAQKPSQAQFEEWLAANNLTLEEFKDTLRSQLIANQVVEHITNSVPDTAEQVQIQQILVADEATARAIIEQLKQGMDFAALAQQYSLDESSRANGGRIDWFPRGLNLAPPEVEAVAFSLQPGQVNGPIKSPLGFHIIKLENREATRPLGDKQQALKQQIFMKWLTEQRSLTTIEKYVAM